MDTGHHKRGGIEPDMIDQQPVEIILDVIEPVFKPQSFGREIYVGRDKKDHGEVAQARGQVVIRPIRVKH